MYGIPLALLGFSLAQQSLGFIHGSVSNVLRGMSSVYRYSAVVDGRWQPFEQLLAPVFFFNESEKFGFA